MRQSGQTVMVALLLGIFGYLISKSIQNHYRMLAGGQGAHSHLAWMRPVLGLSEAEFTRECAIHDAHRAECARLCARMDTARDRLEQALQTGPLHSTEGQSAIRDYELQLAACERAVIHHVKEVAASMNPAASERYLQLMLPRLLPDHHHLLHSSASTHVPR